MTIKLQETGRKKMVNDVEFIFLILLSRSEARNRKGISTGEKCWKMKYYKRNDGFI